MDINDATLMALADGELSETEAARLHAQIAADPDLAARYALFTQSAQKVQQAGLSDPDAAVSPDLAARIRDMAAAPAPTENVVPFHRPGRTWQPMAIAASLALAVGLTSGVLLAPGGSAPESSFLTADLRERLATLPSGATAALEDGRNVTLVASFTDAAGTFCREYEAGADTQPGYVGVACRDAQGWSLRLAVARPAETGGYVPASSLETLDAFYAATGASQPLTPEEERALLE